MPYFKALLDICACLISTMANAIAKITCVASANKCGINNTAKHHNNKTPAYGNAQYLRQCQQTKGNRLNVISK